MSQALAQRHVVRSQRVTSMSYVLYGAMLPTGRCSGRALLHWRNGDACEEHHTARNLPAEGGAAGAPAAGLPCPQCVFST